MPFTLEQELSFLAQTLLLLTALLATWSWIRHRARERGIIALMFWSLGLTTVAAWIGDAGYRPDWVQIITAIGVLAHPYMIVLVAQSFRRVPRWFSWGMLLAFLAAEGIALANQGSLIGHAPWVTGALITYFAVGELYAGYCFVQGAMRSHGVAQRQLTFASVGTLLLGLLIVAAAIGAVLPAEATYASGTANIVGLAAIAMFYLGFSPPTWLVRAWRNAEILVFLDEPTTGTLTERAAAATRNLAGAALRTTAAEAVFVCLAETNAIRVIRSDPGGRTSELLVLRHAHPTLLGPDMRIVHRKDGRFPDANEILDSANEVRLAAFVPIKSRKDVSGTLIIPLERRPLFLDETLRTLSSVAAQTALILDLARASRDQELLAAVVRESADAITVKDLDHRYIAANPVAAQLMGTTPEALIGTDGARSSLNPEFLKQMRDDEGRIMRTGQAETIEYTIDVKGEKRAMLAHRTPFRNERGEIIGLLSISRDITRRKAAEEGLRTAKDVAESATRTKSAFLANMSHEIRTPMNAIIGMSSLLDDTRLTAEQREFVDTIRVSSEHLLTLINDILDFSKIESGRLELERHAFELTDCLEGAIEIVAGKAREKGLDLAYSVERSVPEWFFGDIARLRQIVVNFVSNAVKFTEKGSVTIDVEAKKLASDRYQLHVSVKDTGIGIPPDVQGKLFQSFTQVDASTTRRYGGTGLGLAISKQLVELMGGRIWFTSEPGQGSDFQFEVPLEIAPAPAEAAEAPVRELSNARLLVVDDNPANRRLLTVQGERWGMHVRSVPDSTEALHLVEGRDPIDVAVLDHQMPGLDGISLADLIRHMEHRAKLPMILLTSSAHFSPQERPDRIGFVRILTKPVRQSQLQDALLLAINPDQSRHQRRPGPTAAPVPHRLRVLLAEDNPMNQKVAVQMLRKLGVEPDIVTNGQRAVESVRAQAYDLVFMDVHMPVLDGLEATRRICAEFPRDTRPRIVAMTAEAMQGDRERCLEAGMDDYIPKPFTIRDLERVVNQEAQRTGTNGDGVVAPDGPILDGSALARLEADLGGPAVLAEVIGSYLSEAPDLIRELKTALRAKNQPDATRAAHTLKSTSGTLGAKALAELAKRLEILAREGNLPEVEAQIPHVDALWTTTQTAVKAKQAAAAKNA